MTSLARQLSYLLIVLSSYRLIVLSLYRLIVLSSHRLVSFLGVQFSVFPHEFPRPPVVPHDFPRSPVVLLSYRLLVLVSYRPIVLSFYRLVSFLGVQFSVFPT